MNNVYNVSITCKLSNVLHDTQNTAKDDDNITSYARIYS